MRGGLQKAARVLRLCHNTHLILQVNALDSGHSVRTDMHQNPQYDHLLCVKAQAQPNIALIKYWGKHDPATNTPAVGSLSITLDSLRTETCIWLNPDLPHDEFILNGKNDLTGLPRVSRCLDSLRRVAGTSCKAHIESKNNFPTAAGLASSASGFAALVIAATKALGIQTTPAKCADWARQGSGSAARSIYGGFVEMSLQKRGGDIEVITKPLLTPEAWHLEVVVAVTSTDAKPVSSSEGMERTRLTSPYYSRWIETQDEDLQDARKAVKEKDFEKLGNISEQSCLKMHGLALAAHPGLIYWNAATIECLHAIRNMNARGYPVFFTVDAGPQVKAICEPEVTGEVVGTLESVSGVQSTIVSRLGQGAQLVKPS